jgi:hypothetical protein
MIAAVAAVMMAKMVMVRRMGLAVAMMMVVVVVLMVVVVVVVVVLAMAMVMEMMMTMVTVVTRIGAIVLWRQLANRYPLTTKRVGTGKEQAKRR